MFNTCISAIFAGKYELPMASQRVLCGPAHPTRDVEAGTCKSPAQMLVLLGEHLPAELTAESSGLGPRLVAQRSDLVP